ncbi:MAG: hypothetical protein RL757_401 [Bacteroidota bacterium]
MKKNIQFLMICILVCLAFSAKAQTPQLINYQAVVRDSLGEVIRNRAVNFRVSVLEGANGTTYYSEIHNATTNNFGVINFTIGGGTATSGNFSTITWETGNKFLKTEVDLNRNGNYSLSGTQQLVSVPYALFAQNAPRTNWLLNGNDNTTNSSALGTMNNQDLRFVTNGTQKAVLKTDGKFGLGLNNPDAYLTVEKTADGLGAVEDRNFLTLRNNSNSSASTTNMRLYAGNSGSYTLLNHHASAYSVVNNAADYGQLLNVGRGLIIRSSSPNYQSTIRFFTGWNPNDVLNNYNSYERLRITNDGNIGIGTTAPQAQFHTTGSVRFGGLATNNANTKILAADATGNLAFRDASTLTGGTGTSQWLDNSNGINYNNGNVGIGTSNPTAHLNIEKLANGTGAVEDRDFLVMRNTSSSFAATTTMRLYAGNSGSFTLLNHHASSYNVVNNAADYGQLLNVGRGLIIRSSSPNYQSTIRFFTGWNPNDVLNNYNSYERLRIADNGNVGIGTTDPRAKLEVTEGDVYVNDATKGIILKSPNGSCWRVTIDNTGNFVRTAITCP